MAPSIFHLWRTSPLRSSLPLAQRKDVFFSVLSPTPDPNCFFVCLFVFVFNMLGKNTISLLLTSLLWAVNHPQRSVFGFCKSRLEKNIHSIARLKSALCQRDIYKALLELPFNFSESDNISQWDKWATPPYVCGPGLALLPWHSARWFGQFMMWS